MTQDNRPERTTAEPVQVGKTQIVADVLPLIPKRHLDKIQNNDKASACCRDVTTNTISYYRTQEDVEPGKANLIVIECNVCGRKHRIFAAAR